MGLLASGPDEQETGLKDQKLWLGEKLALNPIKCFTLVTLCGFPLHIMDFCAVEVSLVCLFIIVIVYLLSSIL